MSDEKPEAHRFANRKEVRQEILTMAQATPQVTEPLHIEPQRMEENQGMAMVRLAVEKGAPIETVERLVALQEKLLARQSEIEFNEALNRVQSKIMRVAPDLKNNQTGSKYASYAALDKVVRPLYSEEGFSLSFSEIDCPKPEHIRIICFVSKGAHTREYRKDMPADGKGAKGGDVMTKTHAAGAADSYAKRYLLKDIFNIAIGEADTDGNSIVMDDAEVEKNRKEIREASDTAKLKFLFSVHYEKAREVNDRNAMMQYIDAKDARLKEIQNAPR